MPATRPKNIRSGDLAEQLGLLLLQSVALVAPIPRTEDIGIDAVATLIRDYDSYNYIAEDSFFVQIKSSSVADIKFDKKQTKWLNSLELPFFVGHVDRKKSEISLFCAHRLSNALITNIDRDEILIHLDDNNIDNELVGKDDINIHIGPPILKWSIDTIHKDTDFFGKAYGILKDHIKIYKKNLEHRRVGIISLVVWKTNEKPNEYGQAGTSPRSGNEDLDEAYNHMMPYFLKWHMQLLFANDFSSAKDVVKLLDNVKLAIESKKNSLD